MDLNGLLHYTVSQHGPVCSPDRFQGHENFLEALANFLRRNQ